MQQKQEECDELAQQNEKQLRQHRTQVNSMQNKVEEGKQKLLQISELEAQIAQLEQKSEADQHERAKLEGERDEMKRYASELVEKVKNEVEGKEYMIDRRMINTFLVQFMNPRSDEGTKHHILLSMSKILGFTMEEK